jgi:hypothetical protein
VFAASNSKKKKGRSICRSALLVAIYKENERRKEENLNLLVAFNEESRRYHDLYNKVQEVLNVAGQLLTSNVDLPIAEGHRIAFSVGIGD